MMNAMTSKDTQAGAQNGETGDKASGSRQCKNMAFAILDDYTEKLISMIEQSTQGLSSVDIQTFLNTYKDGAIRDQEPMIRTHYQNCLVRCEQEVFDPTTRREPFKRIITTRFVNLFPPLNGLDERGTYLSRRLLPGFFLAMEKMVGENAFIRGHQICKDLVEVMKHTDQGFLWEDLLESEQAQEAVDDLMMALLPHFTNPMKRMTWMMNLINNDLADAQEYHFEGPANKDWMLDEHGMIRLLRRMFLHLKHQLSDKEHAKKLATKYGVEQTRALLALVTVLDKSEV
ncbi:MAG: hypothetical protein JKY27_03210 [Magnetovibrio sp.]|nr:hypothetical protein [Magnetovibrio sp.]